MASQSPSESLQGEASCSICLGYFQEPVSIPCGHNFCRECITRCWEGLEANFSCPQCRQTASHKSFRPSRELAKIAEIAQQSELASRTSSPSALVCDRSQAHRLHTVLPAEEAAQEYKVKHWDVLAAFPAHQKSLGKGKTQPSKIVCEFEQLHQFLKDQERLLLTQLADLDRAITRVQEEAVVKVSEEMAHLDTLIWEMEGKFQQPASKFLLVRAQSIWVGGKWRERANPKTWDSTSITLVLSSPAANVTLDPATAHPNLHLSEDRKQVRGQLVPQDLPDNPERFDFEPCVLGCQGFTSGRHFWEVEVGQGGVWAIGVARETSIARKGQLSLCPKGGIWGVEKWGGQVRALTTRKVTLLPLRVLPRRVSVHLDYAGGTVAFFDADEGGLIFIFSRASFTGERVRPWLWVVGLFNFLPLSLCLSACFLNGELDVKFCLDIVSKNVNSGWSF
uniref:Zinc finger protein RFP-like n=1 Tax=Anas platyrhynchos TaxID=8839 RepID=A0A8B9T260_ANAPL